MVKNLYKGRYDAAFIFIKNFFISCKISSNEIPFGCFSSSHDFLQHPQALKKARLFSYLLQVEMITW